MKTNSSVWQKSIFLLGAMIINSAMSADCEMVTLRPQNSIARVGSLSIHFGEADDPVAPKAWQGPVTVGSCTFDIGIVEQPLILVAGRYLYVTNYSGSQRYVDLVDVQTCTTRWKSAEFAGAVEIGDDALLLAGKRFKLDKACLPIAPSARRN